MNKYTALSQEEINTSIHPKIFLHVGLHRTGTTSIQHILYHNQQILLANNFYYVKTESSQLHQHGPLICHIFSKHKNYNTYKTFGNRKKLRNKFFHDLRSNCDKNIIIFGEDISTMSLKDLRAFKSEISNQCGTNNFQVNLMLRDPLEHYLSDLGHRLHH